jgi:virginiamycin A acetyltransferase
MSYGECIDAAALHPGTVIGAYTSIGYGVRFVRRNHPWRNLSTHPVFYADSLGWVEGSEVDRDELNPLIIGHDVWIGYNALILPGCTTIGTGAVVGAGAVVTRDVPPYAIVVGNPAVIKRWRFDEVTRKRLLASSWWTSSEADLRRIADRILSGELPVAG